MTKRFSFIILAGLALTLLLAACGDATTASPASSGSMPGMTMGSAMTTAANGTTAPATTMVGMPGHDMSKMTPGATMGSMVEDAMTARLKNLTGQEFETKFLQQMIVHHQSAVDMAKLIPTNTKRPELIKLGQDIINAQNKEITDMTGWLSSWYNQKPVADQMSVPGMMEMMGDMDKLKDADFDKQFLAMMISHHQEAVNMATLIPAKTQRPELVKLGQDIIKTQTGEIQQMQGWQKSWFKS